MALVDEGSRHVSTVANKQQLDIWVYSMYAIEQEQS